MKEKKTRIPGALNKDLLAEYADFASSASTENFLNKQLQQVRDGKTTKLAWRGREASSLINLFQFNGCMVLGPRTLSSSMEERASHHPRCVSNVRIPSLELVQ